MSENGGVFPDELNPAQALGMYFHNNDRTGSIFNDELDEFMKNITDAFVFPRLHVKNDWHYEGKGIELSSLEPVCWWKPDGSETYRVLYGDFKIEDVHPDDFVQ